MSSKHRLHGAFLCLLSCLCRAEGPAVRELLHGATAQRILGTGTAL